MPEEKPLSIPLASENEGGEPVPTKVDTRKKTPKKRRRQLFGRVLHQRSVNAMQIAKGRSESRTLRNIREKGS